MEKDIQPVFLCVFFKKDIQNSVEDEEDSSEDEEFYTSNCRTRSWSMVHHPSTGQNLLMTGDDLLDAPRACRPVDAPWQVAATMCHSSP
jgi:hypothetical protein